LLAFLSPVLLLCILEAGLGLGGYGHPAAFFVESDTAGEYATNTRFGWRFFPRALARGPHPCVLAPKPAGTVRIFVLGGSAAMGTPDPSFSFGRILAVMLRERYPGTRFEVVNGAMVAVNSHVVREIARDCAAHEPDLFVVYAGNNEVIGPFGPGTVFQRRSPSLWMVRAGVRLRATRVGSLLGDVVASCGGNRDAPDFWRGMEMFLKRPLPADDPRLAAVYDHYRRNLEDVRCMARRAGAAVVLSTVAVNLRDCPPFASRHRSDLGAEELAEWGSLYRGGVECAGCRQWHEAIRRFEAAARIDDRYAELQFRIGQCLVAVGRFSEAQDRFAQARDLDVLRFRADSRINAIVREVAADPAASGVHLVDAERILAQREPDLESVSGEGAFYEHVHLTFDGNYALARAVFSQVCAALPQLGLPDEPSAVPSRQRCADVLALTPWDEYRLVDAMAAMTSRAPFVDQFDHDSRQSEALHRTEELRKRASSPEAIRTAWRTYEEALAEAPGDWSLRQRFGRLAMQAGRFEVAIEQLQLAGRRLPWNDAMHNDFGIALTGLGRLDEAVVHFRRALRIRPNNLEVRTNLGLALADNGRAAEAIAQYRKVLGFDPGNVQVRAHLGDALVGLGRAAEAIAQYRKTLVLDPGNVQAHNNLGFVLAGRGQVDEAILHYYRALALEPDYADAHNNLGMALAGLGRVDQAIVHYRKALELKPNYAEAHNNYGVVLASVRGQFDEAVEHFQKALEIKPDYEGARQNLELARAKRPE